ncbi:putative nuclease HARBI1 [Anastrepha obliqua]|uniref:putative nuclease HARBI1 n=1 Tax=Anastrepha obliqua TaxID=95512 RepID=UPI00240A4CE6|nr:putative nuclease HARBI1 [Anastrepha obliqua]
MNTLEPDELFSETRMSPPVYELLLKLVSSSLYKPKQRIGPEERISLVLLYLSQGVSVKSVARIYKLAEVTVRKIIQETCEVIWRLLSPDYVAEPTESQYKDIAKDFLEMWDIPNCVGAIEGKHIAIKCPAESSSFYYNYKKFYSIVLMAVCDAKYTFTAVSIGSCGCQSDGGIFHRTPFGQSLIKNTLPLPPATPLSAESPHTLPHYFVGDDAFPLKLNLMRPYSGSKLPRVHQIFNYRLSRAHSVIENSFGILTARWRVLRTTIEFDPTNCEKIVLACIALHNFTILNDSNRWYCPENYVDRQEAGNIVHSGDWRREINNNTCLPRMWSTIRRYPEMSYHFRNRLADYFVNEGALPYQDDIDLSTVGSI